MGLEKIGGHPYSFCYPTMAIFWSFDSVLL